VEQKLEELFPRLKLNLPESIKQQVVHDVKNELLGYGPIQPLLDDDSITEVMVNGPKKVYIEKKGQLFRTAITFEDNAHVQRIIDRIIPLWTAALADSPVDAACPDGSRVNA
jgi:pilus assembly protein CpaF